MANIDRHLYEADQRSAGHPSEVIDLVCVADLATWATSKSALMVWSDDEVLPAEVWTTHMHHVNPDVEPESGWVAPPQPFQPLGKMLSYILTRLAWEDPALRPLAEYFDLTMVGGAGGEGRARQWPLEVYSGYTRSQLVPDTWKSRISAASGQWDEWDFNVR